jgi:hypothetical protein
VLDLAGFASQMFYFLVGLFLQGLVFPEHTTLFATPDDVI